MPNPEQIKTARVAAGLTQEKAGAMIGATRRAWQEWEAGRRNMPGAKWELFQLKTQRSVAMYKCELIECGIVVERFFRKGESVQDVKDGLDMFQWPDGEWVITESGTEDE